MVASVESVTPRLRVSVRGSVVVTAFGRDGDRSVEWLDEALAPGDGVLIRVRPPDA